MYRKRRYAVKTMKKGRIKIHKEGKWILLGVFVTLLAINLLVYLEFSQLIWYLNILLSVMTFIFFTYFFRNPNRPGDIDDPSLVIAPADGTVVVVEPTVEHEYFKDKRIQISIFMLRCPQTRQRVCPFGRSGGCRSGNVSRRVDKACFSSQH